MKIKNARLPNTFFASYTNLEENGLKGDNENEQHQRKRRDPPYQMPCTYLKKTVNLKYITNKPRTNSLLYMKD